MLISVFSYTRLKMMLIGFRYYSLSRAICIDWHITLYLLFDLLTGILRCDVSRQVHTPELKHKNKIIISSASHNYQVDILHIHFFFAIDSNEPPVPALSVCIKVGGIYLCSPFCKF